MREHARVSARAELTRVSTVDALVGRPARAHLRR